MLGHPHGVEPELLGLGLGWREEEFTALGIDPSGRVARLERAFDVLRGRCETVFAMGLSVGGALCLRLAELRADEVAGLVLVNTSLLTERRSARLLKPRIWPVLGIALVAGLMARFIETALAFVPQMAAFAVGLEWGWLLLAGGSILAGVVTAPFVAIVATLVYFDGRIRWEGFDLAVMAGDMARRGSPYGAAGR